MNLESRARRAVASLKASVAGLATPAGAGAPAPSRRRLVTGVAVGGALAALVLVIALLVLPSPTSLQTVAGGDLPPSTTLPAGLDGSSTLPHDDGVQPADTETVPDEGGPIVPTSLPTTTTTAPDGDSREGQGNGNSAGPGEGGSESDDSDILPGFWASQAYGCSAEEEPVELFYGGGEPGEAITLDSPYGSASVVVGEDGYWEASVAFAGAAYDEPFTVTITNDAGESWEMGFVVADPAGEGCAPPLEYWFSAYQMWGCSVEQPPSDLFFGTGVPGDVITLESPYGGGTAVVDEWGWWELSLTFEGAPVGEAFIVTATSGDGEVWELYFTPADPDGGTCVPPMEYWFSAYQGSGCSMDSPPSDYFYGTGFPGDIIEITSPYGSASALVDEWGWWEAAITFEGAPYDEPFEVQVTAPGGETWSFTFTAPDPETGSCWFFTAYQGSGCSTEQPPTEWFWGTGTPGDIVKLTSPYGLAEAVIDEWGWWEATVTFEGAPLGEAFTIEVAGPDDTVWAFPFIVAVPEQGACSGTIEPCPPQGCDGGPGPWPLPGDADPAYVESVDLIFAESYPVQVSVLVEGFLPTPCHTLAWDFTADGAKLTLDLYSLADPEEACILVLAPFSEVIDLGSFESGSYLLLVNGVEYPFEI